MPKFIGRKSQLAEIQKRIHQSGRAYLISLNGRGGVGKTFMLRQVYELYGHKRGTACFPLIDFSQSKTRTLAWLMDFISQNAPSEFEGYLDEKRREANPGDDPLARSFSQDEVEQAFMRDFLKLEAHTRCIFLFDTMELVQDTLLFYFILQLVHSARNSVFILAGRRNHELSQRFEEALPGGMFVPLDLHGFDLSDALEYIQSQPAGRDLRPPQQEALYLLAERGLPIKLALALDWLSRRLMMESLARYPVEILKQLSPAELENAQTEFERELVAQIATLGTEVDQVVYIMAHVNRRFTRELLHALFPEQDAAGLVAKIRGLDFVKSIEEDYFVLHDEIQRMIIRHVWDANDPTHEQRREISLKVIDFYNQQIQQVEKQPGEDAGQSERDRHILEIERLYYELDVSLAEGYQQFKKLFKELEGRRNIELAALALDTLLKDRPLPPLLHSFVNTFYRGWVLVRRQQLPAAIEWVSKGLLRVEEECCKPDPQTQRGRFLEQEVDRRMGEVHTLLGYCYRLAGNWKVAVDELEQARRFNEELIRGLQAKTPPDEQAIQEAVARLAETLNDIANLLRMQGDMETARRYSKTSLLIREALKDERAAGNCCYVMGMIMWETGNTSEAVHYLAQARKYYESTGSASLAHAWVDRYEAFILFRTGNLERALELLDQAVDETSRNPGLQDEHAEVLILYSRIYRQRKAPGDLERAFEKANQALQVAQRVRNQYRVSEAYITLCGVLIEQAKEQPEKSHSVEIRDALQKGAGLAHIHEYRRLEVVILDIEADLEFSQKNYILAFDKYTQACQKAIEFKAAVFERALSKLGNRLYAFLQTDPD
ncbi:MAG TPA: tetratricopeptide repeat protein, partial [Anaerolineaceae bacterium]|nr:tetratricopeptide repeat protein [Anaerolineaceae bacterium]